MTEQNEPMEDAEMAEIERLLLDEPADTEPAASLKASMETLVGTVKEIAHKSALQVRVSRDIMLDKVQTLRDLPETVSGRIKEGVPHDITLKIEKILKTLFERDFKVLEGELSKLNFIYERLLSVDALVDKMVPVSLVDLVAQADHDDCCMRELAQLLHVDTTQVVDKTQLKLRQSELIQKDSPKPTHSKAVSPLTQFESIQNPPQPAASSPAVIEQLNRFEFNTDYLATFDPIAAAQGEHERDTQTRIRGLGKEPSTEQNDIFQLEKMNKPPPRQRESPWTQTAQTARLQGECNQFPLGSIQGVEIARMFASLTLPDVNTYNDPNGREFGDFLAQFRLKYQGLRLDDDMLVHLLLSKLDGFLSVRGRGATQDKFKENESSTQMNAYMKLKTLRMEGDVTSYCVELEKLTQRAYPEASEQELSRTRASELVAQLSNWPEYLQLYTTMEVAPKQQAYEMVKTMAQRCERSRALATATKKTLDASKLRRSIPEERKTEEKNRPQFRQKESLPAPTTTQNKEYKVPMSQRRVPKCNKCNEYGHFPRDCKKTNGQGPKSKMGPKTTKDAPPDEPRVFTATFGKRLDLEHKASSKCEGLVGERTTATVKLLGLTRAALLDTGSQISIIPLEMLRAGQASGFNLDEDVEQFPLENQAPILDASGNKMQFEGAVRLTLELEEGEKRRVALFVKAGGDDTLVLGTNALRALGVSLITKGTKGHTRKQHLGPAQSSPIEEKLRRNTRTKRKKLPTSERVVVSKRTYLRPGETKLLPVQCTESGKEGILWSKCSLVPNIICHKASHSLEIPVTNDFAGAKIFREGEEVGTYEPVKIREAEPVKCYGDMLERTADVIKNREEKLLRLLYENKSGKQEEGMDTLVKSYSDVFAVSEQELTQTTLVEHSIETGDAKPIKQKARPIPLSTRVELRQILSDLQGRKDSARRRQCAQSTLQMSVRAVRSDGPRSPTRIDAPNS
ncbi:zinc knuckle, partial [Ostertagia ostertagi]